MSNGTHCHPFTVGEAEDQRGTTGLSWLMVVESALGPPGFAFRPFVHISLKLVATREIVFEFYFGGAPALSQPLFCCHNRLSRRKSRNSQRLCSKDKVEKATTSVGGNGSPVLRRITRAAAAAAAAAASVASVASSPTARSPPVIKKAVVEVSSREQLSAELHLIQLKDGHPPSSVQAPATAPASQDILTSEEESTPKKVEAGKLESVIVSSLKATPQSSKNRGVEAGRSASKLKIARASRGLQDSPGSPDSPWKERVLSPLLPNNILPTTAKNPLENARSVRQSLISQDSQVPLSKKYCLVTEQENATRRSSRLAKMADKEPEASARIICECGARVG